MRKISLTQNKYTLVDNKDYPRLNKYKWHYSHGYAVRKDGHSGKTIYMHRLLCGGRTDHIDGNKLNNQRSNLRLCTIAQNGHNRGPNKNNRTGYKGVFHALGYNGFTSKIGVNGKGIYLGSFKTPEEAALAYNKAALKYHGEFAYVNSIAA